MYIWATQTCYLLICGVISLMFFEDVRLDWLFYAVFL